MSTRQQILDIFSARMATVAPASGWGNRPLELTALPRIAWRDTVEVAEDGIIGLAQLYRLRIAAGGYVVGPAGTARTILENMLASLEGFIWFGGKAERTALISLNLKATQQAFVTACGLMVIDVWYRSVIEEAVSDGNYLIDENGNILTDENGDTLTW